MRSNNYSILSSQNGISDAVNSLGGRTPTKITTTPISAGGKILASTTNVSAKVPTRDEMKRIMEAANQKSNTTTIIRYQQEVGDVLFNMSQQPTQLACKMQDDLNSLIFSFKKCMEGDQSSIFSLENEIQNWLQNGQQIMVSLSNLQNEIDRDITNDLSETNSLIQAYRANIQNHNRADPQNIELFNAYGKLVELSKYISPLLAADNSISLGKFINTTFTDASEIQFQAQTLYMFNNPGNGIVVNGNTYTDPREIGGSIGAMIQYRGDIQTLKNQVNDFYSQVIGKINENFNKVNLKINPRKLQDFQLAPQTGSGSISSAGVVTGIANLNAGVLNNTLTLTNTTPTTPLSLNLNYQTVQSLTPGPNSITMFPSDFLAGQLQITVTGSPPYTIDLSNITQTDFGSGSKTNEIFDNGFSIFQTIIGGNPKLIIKTGTAASLQIAAGTPAPTNLGNPLFSVTGSNMVSDPKTISNVTLKNAITFTDLYQGGSLDLSTSWVQFFIVNSNDTTKCTYSPFESTQNLVGDLLGTSFSYQTSTNISMENYLTMFVTSNQGIFSNNANRAKAAEAVQQAINSRYSEYAFNSMQSLSDLASLKNIQEYQLEAQRLKNLTEDNIRRTLQGA